MKKKIIQICAIDATMDKLLRRLNEMSIEEGYDVIGVCSAGKCTESLRMDGFNIHNINIDRKISPVSNLKSIYRMYKYFKREKPDIVHVHTPIAAVLGRIAAKLAHVPHIIYTAHGFYFHENMKPRTYKLFVQVEKIMANYFTDYIFTQSEEDMQTALYHNFISKDKIMVIGNGVDVIKKFNPDHVDKNKVEVLYNELGINRHQKVVTFIGRLVKEKGILDLLDAFSLIEDENIKLLIIGDVFQGDRDIETVQKIEEYKKNKNIIFTGVRNDIEYLLYISDIFCLPSYREGMPRSIIEAMAMNNAVVATNIRGSREEVINRKTGFLVDLYSPEQIATKIKEIVNDEELLKSMKEFGRNRAKEVYHEDVVVSKQLEVFEELFTN